MIEFFKKLIVDMEFHQEDLKLLQEDGVRLLTDYEEDILNLVKLYEENGFDNKVFIEKSKMQS